MKNLSMHVKPLVSAAQIASRQSSARNLQVTSIKRSYDEIQSAPIEVLEQSAHSWRDLHSDPLLTVAEVAQRLRVSKDWVWDHSSRKFPRLPVIRMGDGTLRFRFSRIEEFISERERLSTLSRGRRSN